MRVTVVGDALVDERWDARGMRTFVAGVGVDTAAGLRRLGHEVTLVAALADDTRGDLVRRGVAGFGVKLAALPAQKTGHTLNGRLTAVASTPWHDATADDGYVLRVSDEAFVLSVDGVALLARAHEAPFQVVVDGDEVRIVVAAPGEHGSGTVHTASVSSAAAATARLRSPYADPTGVWTALTVVLVDAVLRSGALRAEPVAVSTSDLESAVAEPQWPEVLQHAVDVATATGRGEGSRLRLPHESLGDTLGRLET